jgi:hypothetical protein
VGKAVAALATGALPFTTGEVLNIDGGFHLRRFPRGRPKNVRNPDFTCPDRPLQSSNRIGIPRILSPATRRLAMPINVKCPQCQKLLAIPDELAGRPVRCPGCKGTFQTAAAAPAAPPVPVPAPVAAVPRSAPTPAPVPEPAPEDVDAFSQLPETTTPGIRSRRPGRSKTDATDKPWFLWVLGGLCPLPPLFMLAHLFSYPIAFMVWIGLLVLALVAGLGLVIIRSPVAVRGMILGGLLAFSVLGSGIFLAFRGSSESGSGEPPGWQEVVSSQGRFRVSFPGKPTERTKEEPLTPTRKLLWHQWLLERSKDEGFLLMYMDLPLEVPRPAKPDALLKDLAEGMLSGFPKGAIQNSTAFKSKNLPACDVSGTAEKDGVRVTIVGRLLLAENRVYVLLGMGTRMQPEDPDLKRFFSSFSVAN